MFLYKVRSSLDDGIFPLAHGQYLLCIIYPGRLASGSDLAALHLRHVNTKSRNFPEPRQTPHLRGIPGYLRGLAVVTWRSSVSSTPYKIYLTYLCRLFFRLSCGRGKAPGEINEIEAENDGSVPDAHRAACDSSHATYRNTTPAEYCSLLSAITS